MACRWRNAFSLSSFVRTVQYDLQVVDINDIVYDMKQNIAVGTDRELLSVDASQTMTAYIDEGMMRPAGWYEYAFPYLFSQNAGQGRQADNGRHGQG